MAFKLSKEQEFFILTLEHTKLKQTKHCLYDGVGFCCLGLYTAASGVGLDEGALVRYLESKDYDKRNRSMGHLFKNGECLELSSELVVKLGLRGRLGGIDPYYNLRYNSNLDDIASMNDSGKTFKEIAAVLREHPEAYFIQQ